MWAKVCAWMQNVVRTYSLGWAKIFRATCLTQYSIQNGQEHTSLTLLGGDMEHTHLVKGLDFALLQKVRSEIVNRERAAEEDEQLMKEIEKKEADPKT